MSSSFSTLDLLVCKGKIDTSKMKRELEDRHDTSDLPEDYIPSDSDVIVGWARQNYHHGTSTMCVRMLCTGNWRCSNAEFWCILGTET